jgi:hypothetical protein
MYQNLWRRFGAVLLVGTIVLNLAVGVLAYRYLGNIGATYTRLLGQGIPFLNNMQTVTAQVSRSYGVLIDLSETQTPEDVARLDAEFQSIRKVSAEIFASPLNDLAVPEKLKPEFAAIVEMRKDGKARTDHFLELVHRGQLPEARLVLHREIYPIQKAYLTKLDHFCDEYQATFAGLNQQLVSANNQSRSVLFGLAAFPAVLLAAIAALSLVGLIMVLAVALGSKGHKPA